MGPFPKKNSSQIGTKVIKKSIKKHSCRCHRKRLLMLRRRVSVLLNEKEAWESTNRELVDNYNAEKKSKSELTKDVFYWQRLYHEAVITQNAYKVKLDEIVQCVSSCLEETKLVVPHLVHLVSGPICRSQQRLKNLISSSQTFGTEPHLPRAFGDGRQVISESTKKTEKRMKHKVGPMVNGVLIQKPTIRLERVMLHQPQDQDTSNNDQREGRENPLTPIVEENEQDTDIQLEHISVRQRRKLKLGSGERWRMRKQEQLEKGRQLEREREMERERRSVSESSDSEDHIGPVIQLQRVSGLLLGVERGRPSEANSRSSEPKSQRMRTSEDPLEGCSWMHVSPAHSKKKNSKIRSPESSSTSNSSDEESVSFNGAAHKKVRNILSDPQYKNSYSSKVEPDSTNNIDDIVLEGNSGDSLNMNTSVVLTASIATTLRPLHERESGGNSRDSLEAASKRASEEQRRSSSFFNCVPIANSSPQVQGKRIRKPKIHIYPGENEYESPGSRKKGNARMAEKKKKDLGKTRIAEKENVPIQVSARSKITGKRSFMSVSPSEAMDQDSLQGKASGSSKKRKSVGKPRTSLIKKSAEETMRTSTDLQLSHDQGRAFGSSQKKKTVGRQTLSQVKKNSVETTRTSSVQNLSQDQDESARRNSRRNRGPVSYKEPKLITKLRRPKD